VSVDNESIYMSMCVVFCVVVSIEKILDGKGSSIINSTCRIVVVIVPSCRHSFIDIVLDEE